MATAAAVPRFDAWLSAQQVEALGRAIADPPAYARYRADAFERFLRLPIEPNPLYRGYGYFTGVDLTGIDPLLSPPPVPAPGGLAGAVRILHDGSGTRIDVPPELERAGVRVTPLAALWATGDPGVEPFLRGAEEPTDRLTALAAALLNRGYRLEVPDGWTEPVRVSDVTVLSAPHEALSIRRTVRTGARTQLLLSEEVYATPGAAPGQRLHASSIDLDVGADAKAIVLTLHAPDLSAVSVYRRSATTGPNARIGWLWNGFGGFRAKVRNQTRLTGNGSKVDDLQTFYGAKNQSYDSSVDITHIGTDTHGQSITRGVFDQESRGMSRGLVRIEPNARKTIAYVSEHAMLLSRGARSDTIPILEILCRDVKATHSTSVAPVDSEKVFYLESRGLSEADAIRAIGEGFLSYVHERAPIAGLRETLYPLLERRWNGEELAYRPGADGEVLAELDVAGTESAPEWRFDAKLR